MCQTLYNIYNFISTDEFVFEIYVPIVCDFNLVGDYIG